MVVYPTLSYSHPYSCVSLLFYFYIYNVHLCIRLLWRASFHRESVCSVYSVDPIQATRDTQTAILATRPRKKVTCARMPSNRAVVSACIRRVTRVPPATRRFLSCASANTARWLLPLVWWRADGGGGLERKARRDPAHERRGPVPRHQHRAEEAAALGQRRQPDPGHER